MISDFMHATQDSILWPKMVVYPKQLLVRKLVVPLPETSTMGTAGGLGLR